MPACFPTPSVACRSGALALTAILLLCCAGEDRDPLEPVRQHLMRGEAEAAIGPLREILAEDPEHGEANFLYGRALLLKGEYGAAIWPLRQALEDAEWRVPAARQLMTTALGGNDFNEVVELADELLEEDPDDVVALLYRAQAQAYWKKDQEAALRDARRVLELDPDRIEAYEPMILALLGLGRFEEAGEMLAEAGLRLEERQFPESSLAWHCSTTATFHTESGDEERAREAWRGCLERFPADSTVVGGAVGFHDAQGEWSRSLEVLERAYEVSPSRNFRTALAARLAHAGSAAEGEALLREATEEEDPREAAAAWIDLAAFRHNLREPAAAAEALGRAVEETRKFETPAPLLLFQWADALLLSGDHERALEVAEEIPVPAQQRLIRGRVAQERGRAAEALAEFDEALRLWPNNPWARYYAALAAEQLGDFDRALEEYRYSARIDPAATDARTRGARLLVAEGQLQRAYQLLFLDAGRAPLEPGGEVFSMYLLARAANPKQLQDALLRLAASDPERLPVALARGAAGAAEAAGPASALGLLRNPPGIDYRDPASAPALEELVRLAHLAGEPGLAESVLADSLEAAPDSAAFRALEGLHRELGGDPDAARRSYERALEQDPDDAVALMGLGRLTLETDPALAARHFDRAVAADPMSAAPKLATARALLAAGRPQQAAVRLEALLAQHPHEAEAADLLVDLHLERGEATARTFDYARRAARFGHTPEAYEQLARVARALDREPLAAQAELHAEALRKRAAELAGSLPGGSGEGDEG